MPQSISLTINGKQFSVETDPDRPLLDVLREELGLTGTKYGCGEGVCGACTVLADGAAIRSCITTAEEVADQEITTIEGLARGEALHPVQQAFLDNDALQCGYCVPGQILSACALLEENASPTREEIVAAMNDNLCRCCNYENILAAVQSAAQQASQPAN